MYRRPAVLWLVSVADLMNASPDLRKEERERLEEEILEHSILFWKDPQLAKAVEPVSDEMRELWRQAADDCNKKVRALPSTPGLC